MSVRRWAIALASLGVLVAINGAIARKERTLAAGRAVYLPLAPRDPRSLMQGDYMELRYEMPPDVGARVAAHARRGKVVLVLDERAVARVDRVAREDEPLAPSEQLLQYQVRRGQVWLGAESWFFEEGTGDALTAARFGELRVTPRGEGILVGLADEGLRPLGRSPTR